MPILKRSRHVMPELVRESIEARGLMRAYLDRPADQRNDYLGWIMRAKLAATRERRSSQMLDELQGGDMYMKMRWTARKSS